MAKKQNPIQSLDEAELTQVNGGFIPSSAAPMSYHEGINTIKGPDLYKNRPIQGDSYKKRLQQGQNEEAAMLGPANGFEWDDFVP